MSNLHIISLYKLHNKLSCESHLLCSTYRASLACRVKQIELDVSSVSSRAVRQARHSQNAWARHVKHVESCRDATSQFGLYSVHIHMLTAMPRSTQVFHHLMDVK